MADLSSLGEPSILLKMELSPAGEGLTTLAQKTFSMSDQRRFAVASGDRNPIHIDQLASRRTQAGAPVVHGMNLLLWALDSFAAARPNLAPLRSLSAHFKRQVYLNEPAGVVEGKADADGARLLVVVDGSLKAEFNLEFGAPTHVVPRWSTTPLEMLPPLPEARDLNLEQISKLCGRLPFRMTAEEAAKWFPAATKWLNAKVICGLAATSHLVGMICPGLHSIYSELSIRTCVAPEELEDGMAFRVTKADPRYALVTQEVAGADFAGTLRAFLRSRPVSQATMQSLAGIVAPDEFAGSQVLIVGGSRGLGELTAKLIATGGGRVLITWQSGEADALRVTEEIRAGNGLCDALHYDARDDAVAQLSSIPEAPTHAYYFATPLILRPRSDVYAARRFEEFITVYVDGFWQLTRALRARRTNIALFYPSSVFVNERPPGMTEYAMAKAAGESLCTDINSQLAPTHVTVTRLPRLPTDQTTSLTPIKLANALEVMLPVVREVQARGGDR
jgi:NADP-dependent 3-hydroxy acid dehydrogenase YdfG